MTDDEPMADEDAEEDITETFKQYAPWIIGGLLMLMGLSTIVSPEGSILRSFLAGVLFLIAGAIAFPWTRNQIDSQIDTQLTGVTVVAIVIVAVLAGGAVLPSPPSADDDSPDSEGGDADVNSPTATVAETTVDESGDSTANPTTGTPEGEDPTPTSVDSQQGIQQIAAETVDDYGMVTGISPAGSFAAFGLHTGEFVVYNADSDTFESRSTSVERQPSHIQPRDDGSATVAWMDAHVFGQVDFTTGGDAEWVNEYSGIWDIDTNADHSAVAAVSSPEEGPGRVGAATGNGDVLWDESLEDASSESVAMTDDGDRVAVGAVNYWTQDGDTAGTPGVRLYDGETGEEMWQYETETETWAVDVHGDEELVAAATDERLIVLNFDGNVVWEEDIDGSLWVAISDDGTTVASIIEGRPVAYDAATGDERWRAEDAPAYLYGDRVAMSDDGSRVIATESIGWTYVVDEGEVIWQEEREDNPANVDIAGDGSSWSIIVQDNDTGEAHLFVYRNQGS